MPWIQLYPTDLIEELGRGGYAKYERDQKGRPWWRVYSDRHMFIGTCQRWHITFVLATNMGALDKNLQLRADPNMLSAMQRVREVEDAVKKGEPV